MTEPKTVDLEAVAAIDPARRTFWGDAWRILRRRWLFWVSLFLIVTFVGMAIVPGLYVWPSPGPDDPSGLYCFLADARQGPSSEHWFGTDVQGCDYYAQVTYGARVSLVVALFATMITVVVGIVLGSLAGYYGGALDSVISRTADGFFALPYLVGAIIVLSALTTQEGRATLVYSTISMGGIISVEATLSFLGIGLPIDSISWGNMISEAGTRIQQSPHLLFFPSAYLIFASLGFVLMGEQLREAFDPRFR